MQDIEILRVIDQMVKEVYDGDLEERGHSVSNAKELYLLMKRRKKEND